MVRDYKKESELIKERKASNKSYFGVNYIDSDAPFYMSQDSFNIALAIKHNKRGASYNDIFKSIDERDKENFNLYCRYYKALDSVAFNNELNRIINKFGFREIKELSSLSNCIYIMVFDAFNQFYIGKAQKSVKDRIVKHWRSNMRDYISLGGRVGVDFFKMKDTTRIFILQDFKKAKSVKEFESVSDYEIYINGSNYLRFSPQVDISELALVERVIINDALICFSVNDRIDVLNDKRVKEMLNAHNLNYDNATIKHYNDYLMKLFNYEKVK